MECVTKKSPTRFRILQTVYFGALALQAASASVQAQAPAAPAIDARRSLAVTDAPILARFAFARVMNQLATLAGDSGLTGIALFRQWWDTQNAIGTNSIAGPHCDDEVVAGVPSINGYPYTCRPAPQEGRQVGCTSFEAAGCRYIPIGLFNRFDLAPVDGSHCGEYRIVFANQNGVTNALDRNLLIFEATLPNPTPGAGLAGCLPIAQFWAGLSSVPNTTVRADRLERFYFNGLSARIPAVVRPEHYGNNAASRGQVRTNQFLGFDGVDPKVWSLREFKLQRDCPSCAMQFTPVPDGVNPFGPLFAPTSSLPQKANFDAAFPSQVASLAATTVSGIGMRLSPAFDSAQSQASGSDEMRYLLHFSGPSGLRTAIGAALANIGSSLTADDIVARAQAMSCAGCHRFNNGADNQGLDIGGGLTWPPSLGFTHVTEQQTEQVGGVQRFRISPALINVFLPQRAEILRRFVAGEPMPPVPPGLPIGGRATH